MSLTARGSRRTAELPAEPDLLTSGGFAVRPWLVGVGELRSALQQLLSDTAPLPGRLCRRQHTHTQGRRAGLSMQNVPEECRRDAADAPWEEGEQTLFQHGGAPGEGKAADRESLMMELTRLVQAAVRRSSWWERRGLDCAILTAAFACLPPGRTPPPTFQH